MKRINDFLKWFGLFFVISGLLFALIDTHGMRTSGHRIYIFGFSILVVGSASALSGFLQCEASGFVKSICTFLKCFGLTCVLCGGILELCAMMGWTSDYFVIMSFGGSVGFVGCVALVVAALFAYGFDKRR